LKQYLKAYAADIAIQFSVLSSFEKEFEKTQLWIASHRTGADYKPGGQECGVVLGAVMRLGKISDECELKTSPQKIRTLYQLLQNPCESVELRHRMREVRETMIQELQAILFLPASNDLVANFNIRHPFGERVAKIFPKCSEDIEEAHKCFGFARYTACAFHIGRAMESACKRLAKHMRARATRDEWQSYINAMNDVINRMPYDNARQKAKRALRSGATNYLFNFKEAWRNETMHPKKTYTREQAREVLDSARSFLQHASTKIFKRA
jgi:hypothetical protein